VTGAASVGAGLEPARDPRPIRAGERIHILGVAGAGASAAARLARWAGAEASGCDPGGPSPYTAALAEDGVPMAWAHDPAHVTAAMPPPDRLAVTKALTAVAPDHPELEAARRRGIPLEPWQQVVADAAAGRLLVGVAGTHGKSTTAGWLVHVLARAGLDPTAFVGALMRWDSVAPSTAHLGSREGPFVVEADEYAGNFDPYRPAVAILTSAEWDHPDVFLDEDAVLDAFERWIRRMVPAADGSPPAVVANVGDVGVERLATRLGDWPGEIHAVAVADVAPQRAAGIARGIAARFATGHGPARVLLGRVTAADRDGTTVEISGLDELRGPLGVRLPTAGAHNVANALGVAAAAARLGLAPDAIAAGLGTFPGVGRRLERKGEAGGIVVYDDYGHHPTAIRATLAAVRQREPGRRVWAVYEPLTFHRTAALLPAFAEALAEADAVAIADIWAGRDPDTTIASAEALAEAVAAHRPDIVVAAPGSVEDTGRWLAGEVRSGDAVLVMGGGRSYRIGEVLLEELARG
jgi:UDP-N-acetylmuramate--alanine ligase